MSGLNAVHFFVISLITYLARNDCRLLSVVESRLLLWIFCQRILTYCAATIFVVYKWQKDTDENDDEFVDTIKLLSYVISWGIIIDNALICH